ncbi:diguanylate cyclase [Blastococcus montanus]|uniref:GGDEF domain-containing protein n=1 Tax=Blastococcus montanus TaxID=3144973 RepID=UPI003208E44A
MTSQRWAVLFACAAVIAVVVGVLAWRRRDRTPAAIAFAGTMAGVATWSGADALLFGIGSELVRRAYPPVLMAAVGVVVAGTYAIARTVTDPSWRPARRGVALMAVEPVVMVVLAALPATRDLVIAGHLAAGERVTFGAAFAVHSLYSYVVVGAAYLHLLRRWRSAAGVFRSQIAVLLGAAVVSTVGNVVAVVSQLDGQGVDVTPLFFVATGLVHCWALLRLGLLRLVPVARDQVVDTVPDAVLVVDPHEVLIDVNPAARRMLRRLRPELGDRELIGRPLPEIAGQRALAALGQIERQDGRRVAEVAPGLWLDIRDTAVGDSRGRSLGRILVVRDVSEQQARQEAVETLNRQLAEQVRVIDRLRAELAEDAVRDPLTGLHNRRHLDEVLPADLDRRPRDGRVAVLAVDIDHFKTVNDRFGHGAGDRVLTAVARLLQAAVRDGDTAVRLGGEEFLVILPGAGREQAVARAEQIRRDVAAAVHLLDGEAVRVTISAGVAVCPDDEGTAAALLEAADRALYTAKATGRNRVVASGALLRDVSLAAPAMSQPALGS